MKSSLILSQGVATITIGGGAMRKVAACRECGEEREIAAFGLCFMCYRQVERAVKRQPEIPVKDRHNPGLPKDGQRIVTAHAQVMAGLGKLGISKTDIRAVLDIIRPYLPAYVAEYLRHAGRSEESPPVNSEHALTAVHRSQEPEESEESNRSEQ
jgi:hypothetical protein